MADFQIKAATREEFAIAIEWAADEGWNPGVDDLSAFHAADPEGFLIGYLKGTPVTSISVVRYGEDYGFLGFYIAKPEARGKGYGWQTWQAGLEHLAGRTVGLDGVVAQQGNYRKSGFALSGRNVRYTGSWKTMPEPPSIDVSPVTPEIANDIVAYDRQFFPADREQFMRHWLQPADPGHRQGMVVVDGQAITGFGVIRQCRSGFKVGPLFADTREIAEAILTALCGPLSPGAEVTLDVPEDNPAAVSMAQSLGFEASFETARMYKGTMPELPISRTFGVTTFELG